MPKLTGEDLLRQARDVKKMQLSGFRLSESSCKLGTMREGKLPGNARQEIHLELQLDRENKRLMVRIRFRLLVTYDGLEDGDPAFSVTANFLLHYALSKSLTKKTLKGAVRTTAVMAAWPYWREFVHSMTVRMGLPAFPVPLLGVTDLQENDGSREAPEPS